MDEQDDERGSAGAHSSDLQQCQSLWLYPIEHDRTSGFRASQSRVTDLLSRQARGKPGEDPADGKLISALQLYCYLAPGVTNVCIKPRTWQRWETEGTTPSPYFRMRLCDVFTMSLEDLGFFPGGDSTEPSGRDIEEITPEADDELRKSQLINLLTKEQVAVLKPLLELRESEMAHFDESKRKALRSLVELAGITTVALSKPPFFPGIIPGLFPVYNLEEQSLLFPWTLPWHRTSLHAVLIARYHTRKSISS